MLRLPAAQRLSGFIAATFTPLRSDGSLALERIPSLVDQLARDGVAGVYALGSTGEGVSLSVSERIAVAEAFLECARGRLRVVLQVGHDSLAEARRLAEHAQRRGVDAISAMPPSYFKASSGAALADSLAEIARAAPELPFYYYHIPVMSGIDPDLFEFLQHAEERVPTLAGIKFSDTRLHDLQLCQRFREGSLDVVFGVDEMLLGALAFGIRGAVGSTYNYATPLYLRMLEAFDRGELPRAREEQARSGEMLRVIYRHCGRSGQKAMMTLVGQDCGPHRLPQQSADADAVQRMRAELDEIGFFQWGRSREAASAS